MSDDPICDNYDINKCPTRCTFNDCTEWKPSEYFIDAFHKLTEKNLEKLESYLEKKYNRENQGDED